MRVLAVDDDISVLRTVERLLRSRGHAVTMVGSGQAALDEVGKLRPDAILLDVNMPGLDGMETLARLGRQARNIPVIIMTANNDVETAVRAFRTGATDFVVKPFDEDKLFAALDALAEPRRDVGEVLGPMLVGESARFRETLQMATQYARPDINVLLHGETGTGKELFARAIHQASKRRDGPFVAMDCSMLAETLIESELFGHEKGAFTGATTAHVGYFERANHGTLFLDEVGNLSGSVQAKLLRVIQERTFQRVGGQELLQVDIRIITAANVDLLEAAGRGAFRSDLYYRIAEATLTPPPLRDREGDVRLLAQHFLTRYAQRYEMPARAIAEDAMTVLESHAWPGNVRELENAIKQAVVRGAEVIRAEHLPPAIVAASPVPRAPMSSHSGDRVSVELEIPKDPDNLDLKQLAAVAGEMAERAILERILSEHRYSQAQLAKVMNVDPKTLRSKLRKYGLDSGS